MTTEDILERLRMQQRICEIGGDATTAEMLGEAATRMEHLYYGDAEPKAKQRLERLLWKNRIYKQQIRELQACLRGERMLQRMTRLEHQIAEKVR